jgi:hypothetical protein
MIRPYTAARYPRLPAPREQGVAHRDVIYARHSPTLLARADEVIE